MLSDPRAQSLAIAEVAYRGGFLDPGYFARLFRKRFGITPREWRAGHAPQSMQDAGPEWTIALAFLSYS